MASLSPEVRIEIEIQRLLNSGHSLDITVQQITKNYQHTRLSRPELEVLSIFLLQAGYHVTLSHFLVDALDRGLEIPWPHFAEALFLTTPAIPDSVKSAVLRGAQAQKQIEELARVVHFDHYDDRLKEMRTNRRKLHQETLLRRRQEMISTLEVLQAQGMQQEQARMLEKFTRIFPNDNEAERLKVKLEKKRNIELVDQIKHVRKPYIPLSLYEVRDEEAEKILRIIEQAMNDVLLGTAPNAELAYDFSIAHIMWENYSAALTFIDFSIRSASPVPQRFQWLRLEILFQLRHFVQVLDEIAVVEGLWADDPDSTFGLLYLKANCLWELSQKQQAIEIMEAVCMARPNFRSARVLLSEWKGEAT